MIWLKVNAVRAFCFLYMFAICFGFKMFTKRGRRRLLYQIRDDRKCRWHCCNMLRFVIGGQSDIYFDENGKAYNPQNNPHSGATT
jgi:hypothetical protein